MSFSTQFLFLLSSLGVFNGFLMGGYFFLFPKQKRLQHRLFGLLILMLSVRIGKSVLYFFDRDLSQIILQIGLSACVFIGPFLLFYIRSVQGGEKQLKPSEKAQLLGLLVLILGVGLIFPYPSRPDVWNPEIVSGIYAVWLIYVVIAGMQLKTEWRRLFAKSQHLDISQKWLLVVYATNVLVCLMFHSILYLGMPSYIFGPLTFSFVFYGLLAFLLLVPNSRTIIQGENIKYGNKKIQQTKAAEIEARLLSLMEEERMFEQANLKLDQVAERLEVSRHILSQVLNDNLGKGFLEFVNEYRVAAAADLLTSRPQLTVEAIGKEVGFRSKTTFYTAFKKIQEMTPAQYAKQRSG
ncbi:MAG: helix-turn-helix domain-containing protein [Bacteroidota bacterium]